MTSRCSARTSTWYRKYPKRATSASPALQLNQSSHALRERAARRLRQVRRERRWLPLLQRAPSAARHSPGRAATAIASNDRVPEGEKGWRRSIGGAVAEQADALVRGADERTRATRDRRRAAAASHAAALARKAARDGRPPTSAARAQARAPASGRTGEMWCGVGSGPRRHAARGRRGAVAACALVVRRRRVGDARRSRVAAASAFEVPASDGPQRTTAVPLPTRAACAVTIGWLVAFTNEHDCWGGDVARRPRHHQARDGGARCRYVDPPARCARRERWAPRSRLRLTRGERSGARWSPRSPTAARPQPPERARDDLRDSAAVAGARRRHRLSSTAARPRHGDDRRGTAPASTSVTARSAPFAVVRQAARCARATIRTRRARRRLPEHERDVRAEDSARAGGGAQDDRLPPRVVLVER